MRKVKDAYMVPICILFVALAFFAAGYWVAFPSNQPQAQEEVVSDYQLDPDGVIEISQLPDEEDYPTSVKHLMHQDIDFVIINLAKRLEFLEEQVEGLEGN